eukprot:4902540-Prymnesium_polylepis.1
MMRVKKKLGGWVGLRDGPWSDDLQPNASAGCSGGWLLTLNQRAPHLQSVPEMRLHSRGNEISQKWLTYQVKSG